MLALLVVVALTVYRVTRLLTTDAFPPIAAARDRITDRYGPDSWQAYLSVCPWCVSVYVAAAVVLALVLVGPGCPVPVYVAAAASALTGLLARLDDEE